VPAALEARGLTWTPLARSTRILDAVDLRIEEGERVLLAGASGAGKSTLLRALAGVLGEAEAGDLTGEVLVDGGPLHPGDGQVGLLLQDPISSLVAGRVGRDVAFGVENLAVPRAQIHERVAESLEAVGFPYGTEHRTAALSGGEGQRLALAGVLAMRPRVLLLDEPTAMLDDDSAGLVRDAVARVVAQRQVSLVVVEHRLDRWLGGSERLIDRLIVLGEGGRVIADGPPDAVLARDREMLLDAGIWLPDAPIPEPTRIGVPAPRHVLSGTALTFEQVGLLRTPRRGLSVARKQAPTPALTDIDLDVRAGELTAFCGRSGAGKSSLLSVAVGLERPTSGVLTVAPELAGAAGAAPGRWTSLELAERAAWVPQRASLTIVGTSVRDCLLATPRALGRAGGAPGPGALDPAASEAAAEALAVELHLDGLLDRSPYSLSGGQLRRLALASALVHGPAVVALDEPSVGQDRHTWAAIAGVCLGAVEQGATLVLSTHDDALAALATTHHTLHDGRLVSAGQRRDLGALA